MSMHTLLEAFGEWRKAQTDLVLATVVATQGSTYAKTGHQMLLTADGDYAGLLSGGCLEGDLAERGRAVLQDGPAQVTYDMRDQAEDALWGLGLGCNGLMRVLLQPLLASRDYQPFAAIAAAAQRRSPGVFLIVASAGDTDVPAGAAAVYDGSRLDAWDVGEHGVRLAESCRRAGGRAGRTD